MKDMTASADQLTPPAPPEAGLLQRVPTASAIRDAVRDIIDPLVIRLPEGTEFWPPDGRGEFMYSFRRIDYCAAERGYNGGADTDHTFRKMSAALSVPLKARSRGHVKAMEGSRTVLPSTHPEPLIHYERRAVIYGTPEAGDRELRAFASDWNSWLGSAVRATLVQMAGRVLPTRSSAGIEM